jgi:ribonuclease HI
MNKIRAFTDGACSDNPDGPGGYSAVINLESGIQTIVGYDVKTTNNRMELKAAIECLRWVMKFCKDCTELHIHSDSAYVVNAITKGWLDSWIENGWKTKTGKDVKNPDLWKQMSTGLEVAKRNGREVKMIWVKGHAGNQFNEMCDKLAKEQVLIAKQELNKIL